MEGDLIMEDINCVVINGRLVRDSELSYTNSGTAICKFSIASNGRKKVGDSYQDEAHFFDVTVWAKRGEALHQYLLKGVAVSCSGHLKQERWEKDGQKRSKVSIEATNIQLLGGKSDGQTGGQGQGPDGAPPDQGQNNAPPPDGGAVPQF